MQVDVDEAGEVVDAGQDLEQLLEVDLKEAGVFRVDLFEAGAEERLYAMDFMSGYLVRKVISR